jgi:predicted short-subunit dehydrogenase-like oxidoreductase (DUF2520 family)
MKDKLPGIFFLGPGRVGLSFGLLLERSGFEIVGFWGRSKESLSEAGRQTCGPLFFGPIPSEIAEAGIVFITTVDGAIEHVAGELSVSGCLRENAIVFHCSGAFDQSILGSVKEKGAFTGTVHPLQAIPTVEAGVNFLPSSWFSLRGDLEAVSIGKKLVEGIGARFLELSGGDPGLYHASAVMASNYLVSLLGSAAGMMAESGLTEKDALRALIPMVRNVVEGVDELGVGKALTGPIARGDDVTVKRQLEAVAEKRPADLPLFLTLAERTIELARKNGDIDENGVRRLRNLLSSFKM